MKLPALVTMLLYSVLCRGQAVQVSQAKNGVLLSVSAQKPYQLLTQEQKLPTLSVQCTKKGKKTLHLLLFSPEGELGQDPAQTAAGGVQAFTVTIGNSKQMTVWAPYGEGPTVAYVAKTEADRIRFIQSLLSAGTISIQFTPFLTGTPATSVFDLSKLSQVMDQHPECALK
ncbi:MAG TPA: hypothetical protein VKV05_14280 [Terriglobales bacterium]|nr:hypothetical protein [Terriglobales bacterium]